MGKKGINPKAWFYGFGRHLNKRSDHVRRALAGSAAEQWLNMELNAYLIDTLGNGLYAYPESAKHDVCVFSFADGQHENEHGLEAVIESKAIYRQYSAPSIAKRVTEMTNQLDRALKSAESCKAIGLVFGVWAHWPRLDGRTSKLARRSSLPGFRRLAGEAIRQAAEGKRYDAAKPTMETLVPPGNVKVGPWDVEIALVGQYFIATKPRDHALRR